MKGLRSLMTILALGGAAIAFASWQVDVTQSQGSLFRPSTPAVTTQVPFFINTFGPSFAPASATVSTLPQVTFLTSNGNPHPILTGDGTFFTGGTYTAVYTITGPTLTGFNFVVSGFVFELGQIIWSKKVVDINTSEVLYNGSGFFSGSGYAGGADGVVGFNTFIPLARPSGRVQVIETFFVHIDGAPAPGTSTASLFFVEQDWVPEPASMLVLGTGLLGLVSLRRRNRN
ncbi:MAG: PEP-CTERM sorting domain-containing protein [Fimbriimonadales bacterium]